MNLCETGSDLKVTRYLWSYTRHHPGPIHTQKHQSTTDHSSIVYSSACVIMSSPVMTYEHNPAFLCVNWAPLLLVNTNWPLRVVLYVLMLFMVWVNKYTHTPTSSKLVLFCSQQHETCKLTIFYNFPWMNISISHFKQIQPSPCLPSLFKITFN